MAEWLVHKDGYKKTIVTEDIVARYLSGESMYAISKDTGVSVPAIRYRLQKSGIDTSGHKVKSCVGENEIIKLIADYYCGLEIDEQRAFRDKVTELIGGELHVQA